ncbi:hypothetical protein AB0B12_25410 [Streptomyces sp. NPDC044780]|uniref:MmyB family transcriptional regulator n=1 Tax=unclassified Streptomyces TaxID=2593676 RepID=UPI00340FD58E
MVLGRRTDILAWNTAATALFLDFADLRPEDRNLVRLVFFHPQIRALYPDGELVAADAIDRLRMDPVHVPDDPRLSKLVGELSVKDDDFRRWWGGHAVRAADGGRKRFHHPVVGELDFDWQGMQLTTAPDQILVACTAPEGAPAHDALRILTAWTAPQPGCTEEHRRRAAPRQLNRSAPPTSTLIRQQERSVTPAGPGSRAHPQPKRPPRTLIAMVTKRVQNKTRQVVCFDATVAGWCQLTGPLPEPPAGARPTGQVRLRPRRKPPWIGFLRVCGLILFSPLLLYAFLEGLPGSPKEYHAAKARRTDRRRRRALVPEQGLDRPFDGRWEGTAGQLLLDWYAQVPDEERLLVLHRSGVFLLAAPSRMWRPGPAGRLRVVRELPPYAERFEVPVLSGPDLPYFRLKFNDGSWLGLRFIGSPDATARALAACRSVVDRPRPASDDGTGDHEEADV